MAALFDWSSRRHLFWPVSRPPAVLADLRRDGDNPVESALLLFLLRFKSRINLLLEVQLKPLRDLGDRPFAFFLVLVLPPCHEGTAQTRAVPERN